jgi:phosphinothricin acetyltransferase
VKDSENRPLTWSIRHVTPNDLTDVARIYRHYVLETCATFEEDAPSVDEWRERWSRVKELNLPFIAAHEQGQLVGYAYCSQWRPRPAYRYTVENSIYLAPDKVGRGIGTSLLDVLLSDCSAVGIRQMVAVIADTGSPASLALHERCGFRYAGRLIEVGFKHGRWLGTLLLQRALSNST